MNNHTLTRSSIPTSPLARTILRFGVNSTGCLLLLLCLFLASRRLGGAFDRPLSSAVMLGLGIGIAGLAGGLRIVWSRIDSSRRTVSIWVRLLLPSIVVFLFCYALSLPGSAPWAIALLWFLVVCEEGAWWLVGSTAVNPAPRTTVLSAPVPESLDTQPESDNEPSDEVVDGLTQQMTRIRDREGADLIFGQAVAEFHVGERSQTVHLAFCPPLEGKPRISVMHAGGPEAAITVAQAEPFGTRFDVRLTAKAGQRERVMIEYEARGEIACQPDAN